MIAPNIMEEGFPLIAAVKYTDWKAFYPDKITRSTARQVVRQTANKPFMAELEHAFNQAGLTDAIVVAPYKEGSKNMLARVFATKVGKTFGFEIDTAIVQSPTDKKMQHCNALERLLNHVSFAGEVRTDIPYIIVDDNVTTARTAKALKDFIENAGGEVKCVVSLTSRDGENIDLEIDRKSANDLTKQIAKPLPFGEKNVRKLLQTVGIDLNHLTTFQADYCGSRQGLNDLRGLATTIRAGNTPNFAYA